MTHAQLYAELNERLDFFLDYKPRSTAFKERWEAAIGRLCVKIDELEQVIMRKAG